MVLLTSFSAFATVPSFGPFSGGDGIFPWGDRVPFPWQDMQGTWIAENDDYSVMFSFAVTRVEAGERLLNLVQLNPDRPSEVLAKGVGYEADNIVRAVLRKDTKSPFFRVYVHAYTPKKDKHNANKEVIKILSISPLCATSDNEIMHFVLRKVSSKPTKHRSFIRQPREVERKITLNCTEK